MKRIERMIYSVLILALTVFAMIQWRRAAFFAHDNEETRFQLEALEAEVQAAEQLMEVAQSTSAKSQSNAREVAELREERNKTERLGVELEKLRAELAQVQAAVSNVGGFRGVNSGEGFPKDEAAAP